jgi:hypothetical protein
VRTGRGLQLRPPIEQCGTQILERGCPFVAADFGILGRFETPFPEIARQKGAAQAKRFGQVSRSVACLRRLIDCIERASKCLLRAVASGQCSVACRLRVCDTTSKDFDIRVRTRHFVLS